jgi:hypothetical protein
MGDEWESMSEVESTNADQETVNRSCEHHGYIRIQTFTSRGLSWNVIDLPMLESYSMLPAGFEELSDGLWTQFWSELVHILKLIQWTCRLSMIVMPTYLVLLLGRMAASLEAVVLVFSVAILGIALRLVQLMGRRRRLVKQFAPEFERFHVYVEYRSIFEFRGWTGFQEVQYLYVFPPSPAFARLQASSV